MKSRITIEVDFDNGNMPVIQILATNSDDVRDRLISNFLQSLSHTSRWCRIEYIGEISDALPNTPHAVFKWLIAPITPEQIPDETMLMQATIKTA